SEILDRPVSRQGGLAGARGIEATDLDLDLVRRSQTRRLWVGNHAGTSEEAREVQGQDVRDVALERLGPSLAIRVPDLVRRQADRQVIAIQIGGQADRPQRESQRPAAVRRRWRE